LGVLLVRALGLEPALEQERGPEREQVQGQGLGLEPAREQVLVREQVPAQHRQPSTHPLKLPL